MSNPVLERPEFPRHYASGDADLGDWSIAETYYRELAERPVRSAAELEHWLMNWSELDAGLEEAGISRQIEYTRQTDDPARERRHLEFIEQVKPRREPWMNRLRAKFISLAAAYPLPRTRYEVLERSARNAIEIYREESIPLLTEDETLRQQYQKIVGGMSVEFRGQELTLQRMAPFLGEPDRAVREQTWRLAADRFVLEKDALSTLYEKMIALRDKIARNAGCQDYRAYMFKRLERFDYTPDDCFAYHDAIEKVVVPAVRELAAGRKAKLGVERLRPWDMDVDPDGRAPLRPFETDQQLADGCKRVFRRVHPDFAVIFETLMARGSLDLGSRKGKAPGGYQETYTEQRLPFIFMNAVGTENDVNTLLHEGGHAFHTWACRGDPLAAYRTYPTEFAEVASMGMECLALPFAEEFYGEQANRARKRHLIDIIEFLPWMARVDAFQHYVYAHAGHDTPRRLDEWVALQRRFANHIDWSGLEEYNRHSWHRKLHFFEVPLYYIEYGIAQLGALQVWMNSRKDFEHAVAMYRAGLTLGGSRPLPELFEAAGCRFDFSEKTLRPLVDAVMEEIGRL